MARVDPSGMYFNEENETESRFITLAINVKIEGLSATPKSKKANAERISELKKSLQDITDMAIDPSHEYQFTQDKNELVSTECANMVNDKGDDVIVMNSTSMDSKIHEARHGGQIARGELDPSVGSDYNTEIDAYRAQFGYGGRIDYYKDAFYNTCTNGSNVGLTPTKISNISDINTEFINSIIEKKGNIINYVYKFNKK